MAVWMQIIGLRNAFSVEEDKARLSKILESTQFDFRFLSPEADENFSAKWELHQGEDYAFFKIILLNQSLIIHFHHPNFIEFSGSFDWFSLWHKFVNKENKHLTEGIRSVFNKIAKAYGINELIYFPEWFFSLDDIKNGDATFNDLKEAMLLNPDKKKKELYDLRSYEFYIDTFID